MFPGFHKPTHCALVRHNGTGMWEATCSCGWGGAPCVLFAAAYMDQNAHLHGAMMASAYRFGWWETADWGDDLPGEPDWPDYA